MAFSALTNWHCWLGGRKGIRPVKNMGDGGGGHWLVRMEWLPAAWSVCLPLLISPCTIKSRSSLLAPAHPGGPRKRAVKRLWCGVVVWCHSYQYRVQWLRWVVLECDKLPWLSSDLERQVIRLKLSNVTQFSGELCQIVWTIQTTILKWRLPLSLALKLGKFISEVVWVQPKIGVLFATSN